MGSLKLSAFKLFNQPLHFSLSGIDWGVRVNIASGGTNMIWIFLVFALGKGLLLGPYGGVNHIGLLWRGYLLMDAPDPGLRDLGDELRHVIENELECLQLSLKQGSGIRTLSIDLLLPSRRLFGDREGEAAIGRVKTLDCSGVESCNTTRNCLGALKVGLGSLVRGTLEFVARNLP